MKPVACSCAIAAAALLHWSAPAAAQQSSAVPPPASGPAASAPASNAVPQPTPTPGAERSATDVLGTANGASSLIYETATSFAPKGVPAGMVEKGGKVFKVKGDLITAVDIGSEVVEGNYGEAARKGAAAVVDKCVDAAIAAACAATGPAAVGCNIAVQTARFCVETYYNKSVGGWTVEQAPQVADYVSDLLSDAKSEQDAMRADQQARFNSTQGANEDYAIAAASQPPPYTPAYEPAYQDDGTDDFMMALMDGLNAASAPPMSAAPPMTPTPSAGGPCHAGHDEQSHPGGCHSAPLN